MNVLAFDTSGPVLTVGAAANGQALGRSDCRAERGHGNLLDCQIDKLLCQLQWTRNDVEGLALITGPGSLTAIRIAWATVAGWAQARAIPVVGWPNPQTFRRRLTGSPAGVACCTHYRGSFFLLYHLDHPFARPQVIDQATFRDGIPGIKSLTGPGVIGYHDRWRTCLGPDVAIAQDEDAIVGGDTLALWGEEDLAAGHSLSLDQSPLDYGVSPDFKTVVRS